MSELKPFFWFAIDENGRVLHNADQAGDSVPRRARDDLAMPAHGLIGKIDERVRAANDRYTPIVGVVQLVGLQPIHVASPVKLAPLGGLAFQGFGVSIDAAKAQAEELRAEWEALDRAGRAAMQKELSAEEWARDVAEKRRYRVHAKRDKAKAAAKQAALNPESP